MNAFKLLASQLTPTRLMALGFASLALPAMAKKEQPNILFILSDDQRFDMVGYAGNDLIQTPEIDRIANEGVRFNQAFATTPISAASRASMLTGMYERTTGYNFGQGMLPQQYEPFCYPAQLKKGGYTTAYIGKLGVELRPEELGFDEYEQFEREGERGYWFKKINGKVVHSTPYIAHKGIEFLRKRDKSKPFCMTLGFAAPHAHDPHPQQYLWDTPSDTLYRDVHFPEPKLADDHYFYSLPEQVQNSISRVRWGWRFDTPEKYQRMIRGYYRMISDVDRAIGAVRAELERQGLADNTVIIFTSDHGYFLGERQLADKWLMYDNSLHTPLCIYDPRRGKQRPVDEMVLNIDIPSTILNLAELPIPAEYQGKSLVPYLMGRTHDIGREAILFEHLWDPGHIASSEAIRTTKWKYIRWRKAPFREELYDLQNDPLEINDLSTDPRCADTLQFLRAECQRQAKKYTDAKIPANK